MPESVSIDFTNPEGSYPTEAMDWNIGNPFNVAPFYPEGGASLVLGRVHDCVHTRYWIDGGLIMELQASAINQNFGLFVDRPGQLIDGVWTPDKTVDQIWIGATFDFIECQKYMIETSGHPRRRTVPFLGSVGIIATDADVLKPLPSPANIIGATCPLQYDPDSAQPGGGAAADRERLRLNGPKSMYQDPRKQYPFHEHEFLRNHMSRRPPGGPPCEFRLEMRATADPVAATATISLSQAPPTFPPDNDGSIFRSKSFKEFGLIRYAGVVVSITDPATDWLQPNLGPFRVRIKKLEVQFRSPADSPNN